MQICSKRLILFYFYQQSTSNFTIVKYVMYQNQKWFVNLFRESFKVVFVCFEYNRHKKIGQNYTTPILARYGMPYVFQAKKNSRKCCNKNKKNF